VGVIKRWVGDGRGYIIEKVVALLEILKAGGYETLKPGKWHLGMTKERSPTARGFERLIGMLVVCCNHYEYKPPGSFVSLLSCTFLGYDEV